MSLRGVALCYGFGLAVIFGIREGGVWHSAFVDGSLGHIPGALVHWLHIRMVECCCSIARIDMELRNIVSIRYRRRGLRRRVT